MRVLLVGLGRWGENHLRLLRELGVTVWVADVARERLDLAIARGVEPAHAVTDWRQALPHVDALDIVTPAASHLAIATAGLAAGRPCFVEKPLATTVAEARQLATAARAAGRVLQVGHVYRFHPVTGALRSALAGDRLGAVLFARGRLAGFKRPRTDVGVTHTDAIHFFDLFADVLGRPATRVLAVQRDYLGRGLDDLSIAVVSYGDVPALVEADYFVPGVHREAVLVGERGSLVADFAGASVTLHAGEHRRRGAAWEAVDAGKEALLVEDAEPLRRELAAFLDTCAGRGPNPAPAEAGVHALEIVEAAARSARLGRAVDLAELA